MNSSMNFLHWILQWNLKWILQWILPLFQAAAKHNISNVDCRPLQEHLPHSKTGGNFSKTGLTTSKLKILFKKASILLFIKESNFLFLNFCWKFLFSNLTVLKTWKSNIILIIKMHGQWMNNKLINFFQGRLQHQHGDVQVRGVLFGPALRFKLQQGKILKNIVFYWWWSSFS